MFSGEQSVRKRRACRVSHPRMPAGAAPPALQLATAVAWGGVGSLTEAVLQMAAQHSSHLNDALATPAAAAVLRSVQCRALRLRETLLRHHLDGSDLAFASAFWQRVHAIMVRRRVLHIHTQNITYKSLLHGC